MSIVAEATNQDVSHIFRRMPLRAVYSYEHVFYVKNGYTCYPRDWKIGLEEVARSII